MTAIAVTIAGSDSGGGAGIQADLKTFSALGVYGASVVSALTAQNTKGVSGVHAVPPDFVAAQIEAVYSDLDVNATKIGMLANAALIEQVAASIDIFQITPIVLDPVMVATSGDKLLDPEAHRALVTQLFPKVDLITPNLHEAAVLTGRDMARTPDEMIEQAQILLERGAKAALVKGGHAGGNEARDYLLSTDGALWLKGPWVNTPNTHGTGCTLSSAIAAGLANGKAVTQACLDAKEYVSGAISAADDLTIGKGHGPLNHFFRIWNTQKEHDPS